MPRDLPANATSPVNQAHPPWALELENGLRCVFNAGTGFVVADQRANYECGGVQFGEPRGAWIIGVPDRSSEPWLASVLSALGARSTEVAIKVAWY
jgi:hypothetical protein